MTSARDSQQRPTREPAAAGGVRGEDRARRSPAFVCSYVRAYGKCSRRREGRRVRDGSVGEGRARGRLARERCVTHSLRVTYTNRRTSRAGRQLATCSLLCSHTRARINLSVSCHVQCSHSMSPAAHRHSRSSCCRRLRAPLPLPLPSSILPLT